MCIVIDTNTIPSVLNPDVSDHYEFRPILDWLDTHKTKIVYGGKTYKEELAKMPRYYSILVEMRRGGRAKELDEDSVDRVQEEVSQKTRHKKFNDQAIVAIVIVSRCRFVCSNDKRSFPFLRLTTLYPKGRRPNIYTGRRNLRLLYHRHISGRCGPCSIC